MGERLRVVREMTHLSARQLAALAKTSPGHVSNVESGRLSDNVRSGTAAKLAEVLGVSLDWLVSGIGPEPIGIEVRAAVARAEMRAEAEKGAA